MNNAATIFEILNARHANADVVASTFVPPTQFEQLVRPGNSLLVGARGTGKTTLLKMLKGPALLAWPGREKAAYLQSLSYISAFIANDKNWSSRVHDFARHFKSTELQRFARLAIISTQTLRAMIISATEIFNQDLSAIPNLARLNQLDRKTASVRFSKKLSETLFDGQSTVSLSNLHENLGTRIDKFITDTNAMKFVGLAETTVANNNRWIFDDFMRPLKKAAELFAEVTGQNNTQWCLCFDELELSHSEVQNQLLSYLRGADPQFFFKLATVPFLEDLSVFQELNAPTGHHDFAVVELWKVQKEDSDQFMHSLASSVLLHKGLDQTSLVTLLGSSHSATTEHEGSIDKYAYGSKFFDSFTELIDLDPSFQEFLRRRGIGVRDFVKMREEQRAAHFRKIQNIVEVRAAFWPKERHAADSPKLRRKRRVRRRTAKRGFVYSGWQNIIEICDNNPRFLLAVLDPLIIAYRRTNKSVGPQLQLEAVLEVANQVESVLESEGLAAKFSDMTTVFDLVDRIGKNFTAQVHGPEFNSDPILSFKVPSAPSPALSRAIGFAVREGAMLLEGKYAGNYFRDGLKNKRIRLSYIFASRYLLPIMLGRPGSIDSILRPPKFKKHSQRGQNQPEPFTERKE